MRYLLVIIVLVSGAFSALLLFAQSNGVPQLTSTVQTRPQALPSSLTTVISQDAYICYADYTASGNTITVQDRQASPIAWINNALGSAGSPTTWVYNAYGDPNLCRWFPNGISINAGATGATGYMIIKCPTRCVLNWGF